MTKLPQSLEEKADEFAGTCVDEIDAYSGFEAGALEVKALAEKLVEAARYAVAGSSQPCPTCDEGIAGEACTCYDFFQAHRDLAEAIAEWKKIWGEK